MTTLEPAAQVPLVVSRCKEKLGKKSGVRSKEKEWVSKNKYRQILPPKRRVERKK